LLVQYVNINYKTRRKVNIKEFKLVSFKPKIFFRFAYWIEIILGKKTFGCLVWNQDLIGSLHAKIFISKNRKGDL